MEQARYWLWTKRRSEECNLGSLTDHHHNHNHLQAPSRNDHDSWEEQAFAEDAAGPHGGCVWPPRSYSCTFCRREFRSAQALGGHMNVHRRDRARLKQSPQPNDHQPQNQDPLLYDFGFNDQNHQYPSQVCTLVYTSNPNLDLLHPNGVMSISQSSPSRVSAPPSRSTEDTTYHPFTEKPFFHPPPSSSPPPPPISHVHQQKFPITSPKSYSLLSENDPTYQRISDPTTGERKTKVMDPRHRQKIDYAKSMWSLNSGVPSAEVESTIGCKRRRIDHQSSLCLFLKPSSQVEHHIQYLEEVDLINPTSLQDLDLELRLGDGPKVK